MIHRKVSLLCARKPAKKLQSVLCLAGRDFSCHFTPLYSTHSPLTNRRLNHLNASSSACIQSASWCVGSDSLTILTNTTCDWSVRTQDARAGFPRLQWVGCTVCHTKWISARQIPFGSRLNNQVRSETDVFISGFSAAFWQLFFSFLYTQMKYSKQKILLLFFNDPFLHCYPQMLFCPRVFPVVLHLLMLNPSVSNETLIRLGSEA